MAAMDPDDYGWMMLQRYKLIGYLGEGGQAKVYKHVQRDQERGTLVAVKKLYRANHREGVSMPALREMQLLAELRHPNVLQLHDVFTYKSKVHLVLEYCPTSLEDIISDKSLSLSPADVKALFQMALRGDLKPSNFLMGTDCQLKLADFGLARPVASPNQKLFHSVVTLWYRPPELLFGETRYGAGVDMWALGLIFAELFLGEALLQGNSEIDQLSKIVESLGAPSEENWPGVEELRGFLPMVCETHPTLSELVPGAPADALDLLSQLLVLDPSKRLSCDAALEHEYFANEPAPTAPSKLPLPDAVAAKAARIAAVAVEKGWAGGAGGVEPSFADVFSAGDAMPGEADDLMGGEEGGRDLSAMFDTAGNES